LAHDLKYLDQNRFSALTSDIQDIQRMLRGLTATVRSNSPSVAIRVSEDPEPYVAESNNEQRTTNNDVAPDHITDEAPTHV
ncbi:MAG: hypothetical protein HC888_12700, partial [Candidatus Competibacteraceae bacterium]|nr:hypothetical protein [Candidatus Competibacteraceae bacterium]